MAKRVNVSLPDPVYGQCEQVAKMRGVSVASVVAEIVRAVVPHELKRELQMAASLREASASVKSHGVRH